MTALPSKAEVHPRSCYGANVPLAAVSRCSNMRVQKPNLLNRLIGAQQKRFRNCQAESLSGSQIDDQIVLGGLLDRNVGGLGPAQDFVDIVAGAGP
jgi:hypothetical protein